MDLKERQNMDLKERQNLELEDQQIQEPTDQQVQDRADQQIPELTDQQILEQTARILPEWFTDHARDLPWRRDPTAYHVWVSEIMLQQTRVEAVKNYYARFLSALPDIQALAECAEDRLLKLWEGLGYYSRVRNMQKAAQQILLLYGGELPADYTLLRKLPGIGPYTAGAIASIAFGIPRSAVDGNVLRVITRLLASREDITAQTVKTRIGDLLDQVIPHEAPGRFNQALMEIGATVCVPNGPPKCDVCPLAGLCRAGQRKITDEIPVKKEKKARRIEEKTVLIIRDPLRLVLSKRPPKGLLAGMYELPSMASKRSADEVLAYVRQMGLLPVQIRKTREAKHIFTHIEWHMTGYLVLVEDIDERRMDAAGGWIAVTPDQTQDAYPVPSAFSAFSTDMNVQFGYERIRR